MAVDRCYTVVVKLGSSVLTTGGSQLNPPLMLELVRQCVTLQQAGHQVIVVTSGAVAAGRAHLGDPLLPATMASKQLLAAVGQTRLIQLWEQLFALYAVPIGQMLLTRADLEDRERFLNARDTLLALLQQRIVPVINENDAVATAEIKIGDNDNLSALVAILASADKLLLLTDQPGLFSADPRIQADAQLLTELYELDGTLQAIAGEAGSAVGTGGMRTKLQAAQIACRAGIEVVIAAGQRKAVILESVADQPVGTRCHPHQIPLERRKWWLWGAPIAGELLIDAGAETALCQEGRSLLPKGIAQVSGHFSRGEVVRLSTVNGVELARGVSRYASDALRTIQGRHSGEIYPVLGYTYGSVAIHRDDMIFSEPRKAC